MEYDLPLKEKIKRKVKYKIRTLQNFLSKDTFQLWGGWPMQDIFSYYVSTQLTKDELDKLCSGLDQWSIEKISLIISRMQHIYTHKQIWFRELKEEEEERHAYMLQQKSIRIQHNDNVCFFNYGYYLPQNCFSPGVFIDHHGIKLFQNPKHFADKHIIDVGGYIGDSALIFSHYTSQKVHTFEATTQNYQKILQTIKLNHIDNITPIKKALGSRKEKMHIGLDDSASSFLKNKSCNQLEEVEVITLDDYVDQNSLNVGLIKVDIEGFEMEFLKGALKTIREQKPSLIISIYHSPKDFFGIKPFIESLELGYHFYIFKPIDHHIFLETCLLCEYHQ